MVSNLLNNTVNYSPDGGTTELEVRHVGERVVLSVKDDRFVRKQFLRTREPYVGEILGMEGGDVLMDQGPVQGVELERDVTGLWPPTDLSRLPKHHQPQDATRSKLTHR